MIRIWHAKPSRIRLCLIPTDCYLGKMFSGIVAATGRIRKAERRKGGLRLTVGAGTFTNRDVAIGDSSAVNGVCLTVVARARKSFGVDVSRETLRCTAALDQPGEINLDKRPRTSHTVG